MGEFEARHYVSSTNDRNIHMPLDSDSFHGVFKLAEETGLPFALHHEAEDALLPELEKMLLLYPRATVIWCHVGRNRDPKKWTTFPSPAGVRNFLQKHPNLYFDIVQGGTGNLFPPTGARPSTPRSDVTSIGANSRESRAWTNRASSGGSTTPICSTG